MQEVRYYEGKAIWSLFKYFLKMYTAIYCSSKLKPTPAQCFLDNHLQHLKKSFFSDIQNGMFLIFRCTKWHGTHLITCAKKHKKLWKSWKRNTTLTIYALLMQCKTAPVLSIIHFSYFLRNWNWNFGCERKHALTHQCKVNKAIQICFLYVQTKYKF